MPSSANLFQDSRIYWGTVGTSNSKYCSKQKRFVESECVALNLNTAPGPGRIVVAVIVVVPYRNGTTNHDRERLKWPCAIVLSCLRFEPKRAGQLLGVNQIPRQRRPDFLGASSKCLSTCIFGCTKQVAQYWQKQNKESICHWGRLGLFVAHWARIDWEMRNDHDVRGDDARVFIIHSTGTTVVTQH